MSTSPIRVGIVGLTPGRSWAAAAHLPGLALLPDEFVVIGVANSSLASGEAAARACDIPWAYPDVASLAASDDVDLVAVTVKVPHHFALVEAAIQAGKHVYCEWPLGNGLAEAKDLAAMAGARGVAAVVGTQARMAPAFAYLADLVRDGRLGQVLSVTIVGTGLVWGPTIPDYNAYLYDVRNGATMLTIPVGHVLAGLMPALGMPTSVGARLATRRRQVAIEGTGQTLDATSPDQVLVHAELANGASLSLHYRGGTPPGTGLLIEVQGSDGFVRLTGPGGHGQLVPLELHAALSGATDLAPLEIPDAYLMDLPDDPIAGNVARMYRALAADLLSGTHTAPTFEDAVAVHRVIDAIERAAHTGANVTV